MPHFSVKLTKVLRNDQRRLSVLADGGSAHATLDVLLDAVLCWRLLPSGRLLIFDDYWYRRLDLGAGYRPKLAVDAFVGAMSHEIAVLDVARRVFLRKAFGF